MAAASAVALVLALTSLCGGGDPGARPAPERSSKTPLAAPSQTAQDRSRPMCENANDYVWFVSYLSGDQGVQMSTQPSVVKYTFTRTLALSAVLVEQVNPTQEQAARTAHTTWVKSNGIFARYDYDENKFPPNIKQMIARSVGRYTKSNTTYNRTLTVFCVMGDQTFPIAPRTLRSETANTGSHPSGWGPTSWTPAHRQIR